MPVVLNDLIDFPNFRVGIPFSNLCEVFHLLLLRLLFPNQQLLATRQKDMIPSWKACLVLNINK